MLSTENPPPDLCEISQLKRGDVGSDERASASNEVDLLKSGLDYNNPLTKFSIRDYVFSTRGKDIKNNWPFSQKNLQVCLKHGAKDVLPPFQSLDSVRNPSTVDNLRHSDVNPESNDASVSERAAVNINSSECEEDKEFPSTTTSQSCSDINSVRPTRNSCLEREAQYLPISQPEFAVRECKKAESNTQSPAKKCRLILKLNNIAEPKSVEESAANTPVVSETMASKVCPVCKTFSSSSNTTLNAHIDQCLSGESVKWTTNSKVVKHRIKPRKTRLMVDIYETALHSTLEDLDRRNGTNWASNMGLQSRDSEACAEEGKKAHSQANIEEINQEGAVYIDSSGTKLRILSKLNNLPSMSKNNDVGPCKFVKGEKAIKLFSSKKKKKKKHTIQKVELRKNSLDGQGSCSPIPDLLPRVEVNDDQQKLYTSDGHKENDPTKCLIFSHTKSDDFGMIKQWVGSKRTGIKKKINLDLENQLPNKSLKTLRVKSVSSLSDRGNSDPISPTSSDEDPVLPPEGLKRKDDLSRSRDGWTGSSLLRSEHLSNRKSHFMSSKFSAKQSRKDSTTVHERLVDPPNTAENHSSSCSNKKMGISSSPAVKNDNFFTGSSISHRTFSSEGKNATPLKKLSLGHISSGGKKFSSLRSKLLSARHASGAESKKNLRGELSNFKNPRLRSRLRSDEEAAVSQSAFHAEDNLGKSMVENTALMERDSGELLTNRTRVLRIRKMGGFVNTGEGDTMSEGSEPSTESESYNAGNKTGSFSEEEAEMPDDYVCEPASADGEGFASFSKSLDSSFPGLSGEHVSQYYSPTELVFHADQEMFSADDVGKDLVTPNSRKMDGDEAQGDYFIDVDPIPIPGPPGSFLPSPGRMGSEELLGQHSSLTTCRLQSSDDGHEVVDMDSSDSPVSAMSTVSNSVARRSSSISTPNFSTQSHFQHENQLDVTKESINPMVEASSHFEQITNGERELDLLKPKVNSMSPKVTHEVQNVQPCCCSRKDLSLQGGSLNYQESQILRRRTMNSLSVLAPEKQVNDDVDNEIHCYDLGAADKEPGRKDLANLPNGYTHAPVPHNSEAIFRASADGEFPSPSTPNPVLRLMGKNLMVVNNDDNPSPQTRPTQSSAENGRSTRNSLNEPVSFHRMLSRHPSMFDNMQACVPAQQNDFSLSGAFKIPANYRPSTSMFSSMSFRDNATSAYEGGFGLITDQLGSKIRPDARMKDSSAGKRKEIIIIDDSPESEASLAMKATHVNPFYSYQVPMVANRSTVVSSSKGMTANLGKWNCIQEGSSAAHSNSSSASLPSSVHLRSMYFSPGFS